MMRLSQQHRLEQKIGMLNGYPMILAVLGVFLISASYTFYGQTTYFLSAIGWIYVGMQWGDRAIMIGSVVTGTAVAMSLIENLPKYLGSI